MEGLGEQAVQEAGKVNGGRTTTAAGMHLTPLEVVTIADKRSRASAGSVFESRAVPKIPANFSCVGPVATIVNSLLVATASVDGRFRFLGAMLAREPV